METIKTVAQVVFVAVAILYPIIYMNIVLKWKPEEESQQDGDTD